MKQGKARSKRSYVNRSVVLVVALMAGTSGAIWAQVTITNTGQTGSSGILMTNGTAVGPSNAQVSIFADSGTARGEINNGGFNGGGPLPIRHVALHVSSRRNLVRFRGGERYRG